MKKNKPVVIAAANINDTFVLARQRLLASHLVAEAKELHKKFTELKDRKKAKELIEKYVILQEVISEVPEAPVETLATTPAIEEPVVVKKKKVKIVEKK